MPCPRKWANCPKKDPESKKLSASVLLLFKVFQITYLYNIIKFWTMHNSVSLLIIKKV